MFEKHDSINIDAPSTVFHLFTAVCGISANIRHFVPFDMRFMCLNVFRVFARVSLKDCKCQVTLFPLQNGKTSLAASSALIAFISDTKEFGYNANKWRMWGGNR